MCSKHHYNELVQSCTDVLAYKCWSPDGTDPNKCHSVMILTGFFFFFTEKIKTWDAKMITPTNRESYGNCNICQKNDNMIYILTISFRSSM